MTVFHGFGTDFDRRVAFCQSGQPLGDDVHNVTATRAVEGGDRGGAHYAPPAVDAAAKAADFAAPACFVQGTRIATPRGEIAVEDLSRGDLVLTRDAGIQPIRWTGTCTGAAVDDLAPVTIMAGALGNVRNMQVGPQHRMLISDWRAEILFAESEFLVTARDLVNGETIFVQPGGEVTYHHILFDTHQLVFAEGIASESFHLDAGRIAGLNGVARGEVFTLFPELQVNPAAYGPSARATLSGAEVRMLMAAIGQPAQTLAAE
jgi:hypothetical protein